MPNKKLTIAFLVFAILGFLDATYLTVAHYTGALLPCVITHGCDIVTHSAYSQIGPIPIALLGALYYAALLVLVIVYLDTKQVRLIRLAAHFSWIGLITSAALVGLQLFVIHALCQYCLLSALSSTILFIIGQIVLRKTKFPPPTPSL